MGTCLKKILCGFLLLIHYFPEVCGRHAHPIDFRHSSHTTTLYNHNINKTKDSGRNYNEIDIIDHETWWRDNLEKRNVGVAQAVYPYDDPKELSRQIYEHVLMGNEDEYCGLSSYINSVRTDLHNSDQKENPRRKPMICQKAPFGTALVHKDIPYRFTVIGDSHAHSFETAGMRVENDINVTISYAATMYGLKNFSSFSGAAAKFQKVIEERRMIGNDERNILVVNLGENDVSGLGWRKYLANETEGIRRSLSVLNNFLRDQVEKPGGYSRIVLVAPTPPTVKNDTDMGLMITAHDGVKIVTSTRVYNTASFEARAQAIFAFNRALKLFCSQRAHCSYLDINAKVWGRSGVLRPYVNILMPDVHLKTSRVFGLILQGLLESVEGYWCVYDDGDDGSSESGGDGCVGGSDSLNKEKMNEMANSEQQFSEGGMLSNGCLESQHEDSSKEVIGTYKPMGFEPVLFVLTFYFDTTNQKGLAIEINAPHYITPLGLVQAITTQGTFIRGVNTDDESAKEQVIQIFREPGRREVLEKILVNALGEDWGANECVEPSNWFYLDSCYQNWR